MRVLQKELPLLETGAAWLLAFLWVAPLLWAFWASVHPAALATHFDPFSLPTLDNFRKAWTYAPFPRHLLNTVMLVTMILAAQLVLCTLAGYAFARFDFAGHDIAFGLVLVQLMVMPEVLIVENYRTMAKLGLVDTILGIGLPYMASAFGIFLLRQTFKTIPRELEEAAKIEGASRWYFFRRVTFPLLMPTTLFVLVNATINSFKLVDDLFILTKGGPDNASNLLLYYIYQVAFSFFDTAYASTLTVVLLAMLAGLAIVQFQLVEKRVHYR